jgi:hypothetical protein
MTQPTVNLLAYMDEILAKSSATPAQRDAIRAHMCAYWRIRPPVVETVTGPPVTENVTKNPRRGRPPKGTALSVAERVRRFRERQRSGRQG